MELVVKKTEALEWLQGLKSEFVWDNDSLEDIKVKLGQIETRAQYCPMAPKFYIRTSYFLGGANKDYPNSLEITVKPSVKAKYSYASLGHSFVVNIDAELYANIVKQIANWIDGYVYKAALYDNIAKYQAVLDELILENNIPFSIKLTLGQGVIDVSDKYIVLGLAENVVASFNSLALFSENVPNGPGAYKARLAGILKVCTAPIDFVKVSSHITKGLGVYSLKTPKKLMRSTVIRNIANVRVGTGYYDKNGVFAIVVKEALTPEDAEAKVSLLQANNEPVLLMDNAATKKELAVGKTKLVVFYKVAPFNRNREAVSISLEDVLNGKDEVESVATGNEVESKVADDVIDKQDVKQENVDITVENESTEEVVTE